MEKRTKNKIWKENKEGRRKMERKKGMKARRTKETTGINRKHIWRTPIFLDDYNQENFTTFMSHRFLYVTVSAYMLWGSELQCSPYFPIWLLIEVKSWKIVDFNEESILYTRDLTSQNGKRPKRRSHGSQVQWKRKAVTHNKNVVLK